MAPPPPPGPGGPHAAVKRELLVRLLDGWLPAALHGSGRATYLDVYPTEDSVSAALRVAAEFPDLLERHRLDVVLIDADGDCELTARVAAIQRRIAPPSGVSVQVMPAARGGRLASITLPASGPVLGYLDATGTPAPDPAELAYVITGSRTQALLALDSPSNVAEYRRAMTGADAGAVACVELVGVDGRAELLLYRAPASRGLETFKETLWAVDEYAGVCYRDPRDPAHALLDISLTPHPGPLRRALLNHLAEAGTRTVADLRRYALAETVYRAADVLPVLTAMASAGTVRRDPAKGRLTAEALISLP